jgi:hypothetical protein
MKKLLLFALLAGFSTVTAQHASKDFNAMNPHFKTSNYSDRAITSNIIPVPGVNLPQTKDPVGEERNISGFDTDIIPVPGANLPQTKDPVGEERNIRAVNSVAIGQSGNAFGFAFTRTTYLWADNNIKSIAFMHRMTNPPGTGYLAYDFSKDGGSTWQSNIQTYDPTLEGGYDGRYPQGAIYNPPGNTNPDEAYYHSAPTLDGSNTG